jgi:hypothetical protein
LALSMGINILMKRIKTGITMDEILEAIEKRI